MKVVFYSEQCDYCKKLLAYLDKYSIKSLFKLVNIDKVTAPKDIDIVPTIIDTELNQPLKGKKAFEYLLNIKYFNNPTNNVDYVKDIPANPNIPEDEKAVKSKTLNLVINGQMQVDDAFNDMFKEVRDPTEPVIFNQQTSIRADVNEKKHVFNYVTDTVNENTNQDTNINTNTNSVSVINESQQFHENNSNNSVAKATQEMSNARQIQDKKLSVLMQMKRR